MPPAGFLWYASASNIGNCVCSESKYRFSTFDERLLRAHAQQLQGATCQSHKLGLSAAVLVVGFDVLVGNGLDHLDDLFGFLDELREPLVLGFEELE